MGRLRIHLGPVAGRERRDNLLTTLATTWRTLRDNFSPLRYPNFRFYFGGQTVSLIGTFLQVTAQAWVVWQLTHSEAALGIVGMLNALPLLLFSPYAGIWVDRLDRRKLLIATQVAAMLLAFVLAVLTQAGLVQIWHLYVLSFLLGTVNALDLPAQQAFLGDLTGMAEVRQAVNLNVMIVQVSRILGPALAGPLVARIGVAPAFWLNGVSFLAVIASLIVVRAAQQQARPRAGTGQLKQIVEAVAYLRGDPRMVDVFLLAILQTVFVFSILINFMPAVASTLLNGNAETLGLLMAASGLGALLAVVAIIPWAQARQRSGGIMLAAQFWLAFWLTLFAHARIAGLSMTALFMISVGATMVLTMTMGLVQLMSPPAMRGRLLSLFIVTTIGAQPLAALWIGQLGQRMGVETAIQANAILLALAAGLMLMSRPAIWHYEFGRSPAVQPVPADGNAEGGPRLPDRTADAAQADLATRP